MLGTFLLYSSPFSFRNYPRKEKAEEIYLPADVHGPGIKWGFAKHDDLLLNRDQKDRLDFAVSFPNDT